MAAVDGKSHAEGDAQRFSTTVPSREDPSVPLAAEVLSAAAHPLKATSRAGAQRIRQRQILVALLVIMDLCVFVIALRLAQWTYTSPWLPTWLQPGPRPAFVPNLALWLAVVVPTLKIRGLYRFRYRNGLYGTGRAVGSIIIAGGIYAILIFLLNLPTYRIFVAFVVAYSAVLLAVTRIVFGSLAAWLPPMSRRVLVVGSGPIAESTARMITQYRRRGLYLVVPPARPSAQPDVLAEREERMATLDTADIEQIAAHIRALDIDDVVITREWYKRNCLDVEHAFTMLNHLPAQVHVAPDPPELMMRMSVEDFSGLPVVSLNTLSLPAWQLAIKRLVDLALAALLLAVASPFMLVIAILIRATSPGPAIFKQVRVGQFHRLFVIYKFRTMTTTAPEVTPGQGARKRRGDPRITGVGRWLRRTSIDELPQLVNVLLGQMSLVGPRPEMPEIAARYQPWQFGRLMVPQGITGWWQVNGRGERLLQDHIEDDIYYVRNFSLLLDARILLLTLRAVITGRGAF